MTIAATCPSCGQSVKIPDEFLGKDVKCPHCERTFQATEPPPGVARVSNPAIGPLLAFALAVGLLVVYWLVALDSLPPGIPGRMAAAGPVAVRSTAQTLGLLIAAVAAFSLLVQAIHVRRAGRLLPWAIAFLAGVLLLEPQWSIALGFAAVVAVFVVLEMVPARAPKPKDTPNT
jgi:hypothetical protein